MIFKKCIENDICEKIDESSGLMTKKVFFRLLLELKVINFLEFQSRKSRIFDFEKGGGSAKKDDERIATKWFKIIFNQKTALDLFFSTFLFCKNK